MKTEKRIVEIIQLLNAATLQQMNEREKEKKNEKMINVDEEPTKDVKMKKIVKKNSRKRKKISIR